MFLEELIVSPVDINISFVKSPGYKHTQEVMTFLWRWFGAFMKLDDAHICLTELVAGSISGTPSSVLGLVRAHYSGQVSKQVVKLLFSANVVGNPIGLFRDIRTGVVSLREQQNVHGFGQLVAHTAAGISNSTGALTSFASSQLRAISGDESYTRTTKPTGLRDGARSGLRSLGEGFVRGITGIVMTPAQKVRQDGAKGIVPGLLQGVIGLVAQPVAGTLEAVSSTTRGLHSHVVGYRETGRQRLPRYVRPDGTLEVYNEELALHQSILSSIGSRLQLLDCIVLKPDGLPSRALLLSSSFSLFYIEHGKGIAARVIWKMSSAALFDSDTSTIFATLDCKSWTPPSVSDRAFDFIASAVHQNRIFVQQRKGRTVSSTSLFRH